MAPGRQTDTTTPTFTEPTTALTASKRFLHDQVMEAGAIPDSARNDPPWATTRTRRLRPPVTRSPAELESWRETAVGRLRDLLALPDNLPDNQTDDRSDGELIFPAAQIDGPEPEPILITVRTGDGDIPCWLLQPASERRLDAAVIAVAGHGRGIDALIEQSPDADDFDRGLARKLAASGFTVLCPEMISFGRRRTPMPTGTPDRQSSCQVDAMRGLLTGRPVLGQRVADTLATVRAARRLDGIDPAKIAVVGGSGGGAIALLATALDDQLPAGIVGTFFSSFAASFGSVPHCICNAVPDLLTWFEMADIAAMIAPRQLIIEAGRRDPIFPSEATESAYEELVPIWQRLGAAAPELVITETGHEFRADDSIARLRAALLLER